MDLPARLLTEDEGASLDACLLDLLLHEAKWTKALYDKVMAGLID
jgi:hypothetical protein